MNPAFCLGDISLREFPSSNILTRVAMSRIVISRRATMRFKLPGKKIHKACNNRAATALLAVIRSSPEETIPRWCEAKGLCRAAVTSRIKGYRKTIPTDLALAIEAATEGKVPAPWWLERAVSNEVINEGR